MRSFAQASASWDLFLHNGSLDGLRLSIHDTPDVCTANGTRSACWRAVLLCKSVDTPAWPALLQSSRESYSSLRSRFMRSLDHADELDDTIDPLADDANSPWHALRNDEAARQEIIQDVDRCMPENYYFRQPATQDMLLDILFVWAKLNPDTGYRQGMHEVLAPIVWAMERDAIDPSSLPTQTDSKRASLTSVFDATFIEHDSFNVFAKIMDNIKSAYATSPASPIPTSRPASRVEASMVARGRRIIERDLATVDPPLAEHLVSIEIIPQVFLMRWIRLLFGREFSFDEVLLLWDNLFASDPSLQCIDLICVSMLLRIRWQLLESDYNTALAILLKYPPFPASKHPASLVDDALYLKSHFNFDGGCHVIGRATGRPPPLPNRQSSVQSISNWQAEDTAPLSPRRQPTKSPRNLEGLVQDAARSIFSRGELWSVSKAVREAVGEVRKNVNQLQTQARSHSRSSSNVPAAVPGDTVESLRLKLHQTERRSKSLSKMLENALEDLWKHQKVVVEQAAETDDQVKSLTMAIAKVQLAQVYLDDQSLPLPPQEEVGSSSIDQPGNSSSTLENEAASQGDGSATTGTTELLFDADAKTPSDSPAPTQPSTPPPNPSSSKQGRPNLGQPSFSWMLGQEEPGMKSPRSTFISASPFNAREAPASRQLDALFGDPIRDMPPQSATSPRNTKARSKAKAEAVTSQEDVFDLGNLFCRTAPGT